MKVFGSVRKQHVAYRPSTAIGNTIPDAFSCLIEALKVLYVAAVYSTVLLCGS